MNTKVPFSGFYESMHMDSIEKSIESEMESMDLTISCIDPNYRQMMVEYSKEYTSWWLKVLEQHIGMVDIQYTWVGLYSPKEYNFTTDRICIDISEASLAVIHDYVVMNCLWDEFADYVRYALMPRSGFIPFYTNNAVNWGDLPTWDHNQLGLMLSFLDSYFAIEQNGEFNEMALNVVNRVGLGN